MAAPYLHEIVYPRPKESIFKSSWSKTPLKRPALRQIILPYCKGYCDIASVHGVGYLNDPKRQHFERAIWSLLLITTTISCIYVYTDLADLYSSQRLQTIVEDSLAPIFTIEFPAIGICPRNRINWLKLLEAHQLFLPANTSTETVQTFRQFFAVLSDFRFDNFVELKPLTTLQMNRSLLDNVDIKEVMQFVSFTCDELFEQPCFWRRQEYDCCHLFSLERTEYGFCFVFNSLINEKGRERRRTDRYYPYHNSKSGEGSGLDVRVNLDKSKQNPNVSSRSGIYVMVKHPDQWHSEPRFISDDTYTKVPVRTQFTSADKRARTVSPEVRKCLFKDESALYKGLPELKYRRGNCLTRCHQEYVFKQCKCNLNLFFPQDPSENITICKAKDFKCLYEYRDLFKSDNLQAESEYIENSSNSSMACNCLNSCQQLIFLTNYNNYPKNGKNDAHTLR
ncbi:pickpocket protein 19 [Anastrepha ludens]|uniref:pickpocket protein 19 n=1 Tax=Anastrepha ludens TaxID=28586 RepID=UPI0023AEDF49|nr:pickpocket protein 19 [Anastrepha ludens]